MSSPFYTVLLFKGSKVTVHKHTQHCSVFCVWGNKKRTSRCKVSAPLTGEAGAAREAPSQGAIGGNSLNQTESLSHKFSILMNIIVTSVYRNPARLQRCWLTGQTAVSGAAKLVVVVNLQRGGDRLAQHFRGYSWRLKFLSLKYPNAWAVRVSGENGEL